MEPNVVWLINKICFLAYFKNKSVKNSWFIKSLSEIILGD